MERDADKKEFAVSTNRFGTWSAKWDVPALEKGRDIISLSIADMEYQTCPSVQDAIIEAAKKGIYGYTEIFDDFAQSARRWHSLRHGIDMDVSEIMFFPRLVQMVAALVKYGFDRVVKVAIIEPAYDPIVEVLRRNNCQIRVVNLQANSWEFDDGEMQKAIAESDIFMLCSPHNPTGRVWTEAELKLIGNTALKHNTLIVSDDVHCEFVRAENTYLPLAVAVPELLHRGLLITAYSPGKTFNVAGLEVAAIHIPNTRLYQCLQEAKRKMGLHNPNYFSIPAVITAWNSDGSWVEELNKNIDKNISYVISQLADFMPLAKVRKPQGSYLLWVDVSAYFADDKAILNWTEKAKVMVSHGKSFGDKYQQWIRLNVAMPQAELKVAIKRLFKALPNQ